MALLDKTKEEIGWMKVVFGLSVAVEVSLIAWLVQNYAEISAYLAFMNILSIVLVGFGIVHVSKVAYRKMGELENM